MQDLSANKQTTDRGGINVVCTKASQNLCSIFSRRRKKLTWGPFLSERQWGTIREDRSGSRDCWLDLNFDDAHQTSYLSGEDGMFGITDTDCTICFALSFYNGEDYRVKERLFGLSNPQGNHGEDVKEIYFYLTNTPEHNYMKARFIYPVCAFPYDELKDVNAKRNRQEPEYELWDTDQLNVGWWEIDIVYVKKKEEDILCSITCRNKSKKHQTLRVIPTIWFRNMWSTLYSTHSSGRPSISKFTNSSIICCHREIGTYYVVFNDMPDFIFTENESSLTLNDKEIDIHESKASGTKCYAVVRQRCAPGSEYVVYCHITRIKPPWGYTLSTSTLSSSISEQRTAADKFYDEVLFWLPNEYADLRQILRNAYSGLLWNKQFYEYKVKQSNAIRRYHFGDGATWNQGTWDHFEVKDILSMPDKWEFPWFATWDLFLHLIPLSDIDPDFCMGQIKLTLSPKFMSSTGQLPGCEFDFDDPNPCLQGLACWEVFKKTNNLVFLEGIFPALRQSLFWWLNHHKTLDGTYSDAMFFESGFLGLDNICVFDRSKPPKGYRIFQCDAYVWVFHLLLYCIDIAWALARVRMISKVEVEKLLNLVAEMQQKFRHMHQGIGCDFLITPDGHVIPLLIKSYVALTPLFARRNFQEEPLRLLKLFQKTPNLRFFTTPSNNVGISLLNDTELENLLKIFVIPNTFIGPFGVRSLSVEYAEAPFTFNLDNVTHTLAFTPGESDSHHFGGNSNWRGPVWICLNYLIIDSLHGLARSHPSIRLNYLGKKLLMLEEIWHDLCKRILNIFTIDDRGRRPVHGDIDLFGRNGPWIGPDYVLFFEYFNGNTGKGCGANHQTGWTALVATIAKLHFTGSA